VLQYLLANDVYACKINGASVFLELRTNRYFTIPPDFTAVLDTSVAGFSSLGPTVATTPVSEAEAGSLVDSLLERGILSATPSAGRVVSPPMSCMSRTISPRQRRRPRERPRASQVTNFVASIAHVRANLSLHRLLPIIEHMRALRAAAPTLRADATSEREFIGAVETFRRLRTYVYTAKDACLFDSLVLTHFLHRYGLAPTFTIGVHNRPFAAHAWVQIGNFVIDDRLEALQRYTPILVI
jgi:hypothetical protein